jgi:hypothetical protein
MDGTELVTIEITNMDGSSTFQNFPIPVALAISDRMMVLCMESQARDARR